MLAGLAWVTHCALCFAVVSLEPPHGSEAPEAWFPGEEIETEKSDGGPGSYDYWWAEPGSGSHIQTRTLSPQTRRWREPFRP